MKVKINGVEVDAPLDKWEYWRPKCGTLGGALARYFPHLRSDPYILALVAQAESAINEIDRIVKLRAQECESAS